jgi:hypothetical protein
MSHPFPSTYCPGSLTGDPRRGRPPPRRGPAIPSTLRPNWPYHCGPLSSPVPCHHSVVIELGPQRRTAAGPHRWSSSIRFAPPHPQRRQPPPPSGTWAHAHGDVPTSFPRWQAKWAAYPRGRARPRSDGPNSPPAQLAEEIPFLFLFLFLFFI